MSALESVLVVGASLAGHSTARALRHQGFDGRLTLVGEEPERPYDRPPLSKEFLAGTLDADHLRLEPPGESLEAQWLLGSPAVALDAHRRTVTLADRTEHSASAVVIATGSTARTLPGAPPVGVHTLRTLADARALQADLVPGARLVVVGAGFVGAEVAATAHSLGLEVTVVEAAPAPLSRQLGAEMGGVVAGLHAAHGVALLCDAAVSGLVGDHRVRGVALADGRLLPADVVLVGIGASPAVEWLRTSGIDLSHGVVCDARGAANAPGVWAVGDCSAWYDPVLGRPHRIEHWTESRERPAHLVRAMLAGHQGQVSGDGLAPLRAPYFWSDQYGVRIQFAGHREETDQLVVEDGSADEANILATWRRDGVVVAVLGLNQTRAFARHRKALGRLPVAA
ncbi:MAG TPA: FAD-dependent oxidoreductase [Propionibacteriaceae bacterium]|nr:FAD-dependent oxidoreductase [Propionibacteriaceae bacterium]